MIAHHNKHALTENEQCHPRNEAIGSQPSETGGSVLHPKLPAKYTANTDDDTYHKSVTNITSQCSLYRAVKSLKSSEVMDTSKRGGNTTSK